MNGGRRDAGPSRNVGRILCPANDREVIFNVLIDYFQTGRFVARLLDQAQVPDDGIEYRGFCTEIICGVVRRQGTLNHLLTQIVSRPRQRVELELWTLLLMGSYQLIYMSGVPQHAALHTSVELAKRMGRPGWSGFVNGVLRGLSRLLTSEESSAPSERAVAIRPDVFRLCRESVFPSPVDQPVEYISAAFSFPSQSIATWLEARGFDETLRLAFWFNTPGSASIRINLHRSTREDVISELAAAGIRATAGRLPEAVCLERLGPVALLPGHIAGRFTVQDESAMSASDLLDPQPETAILDVCAAPGTKTTHLAERMRNRGSILATDIRQERLESVCDTVQRLGIEIVRTMQISENTSDLPADLFDGVLVDVPCSNSGVLGKRPEARWRLEPSAIEQLRVIQQRLLLAAVDRVRPGGRVVYSTCSINPDENEAVVRRALHLRPQMQLETERKFMPGQPADGAYQALLIRRS